MACLGALLLPSLARAGEIRGVLELFTSQGCSSCPPADRLLVELARDPDVIALSLPVDYWDYIGWKDTLALPAHGERQKAYAAARGDNHVYTPQIVVNGLAPAIGSDAGEIARAAQRSRADGKAMAVALSLTPNAQGGLRVSVPADAKGGSATLHLLRVAKQRSVAVGRGENKGSTLTYVNVLRGAQRLADWTGQALTHDIPASHLKGADFDSVVVVLQAGSPEKPGVILGAAKGPGL